MRSHRDLGPSSDDAASSAGAVGKRTLTASVQRRAAPAAPPATTALAAPTGDAGAGLDDPFGLHLTSPVQRAGGGAAGEDPARTQAIAAEGVAGSGGALPYLDTIQRSFGPAHDVGGIEAHVGGPAATAASAIGAEAYATGTRVAFGSSPDLHTAAHEAAHVVQQRAGVHLRGGVGEAGDRHEQHADAVADRVVRGESAADLLSSYRASGGDVAVQRQERETAPTPAEAHERGQASAASGPAATIAEQIRAGGIHVVIARQSVEDDIPVMAAGMMRRHQTLAQVLAGARAPIGGSREWQTLNGLGDDIKGQPLTSDQATQLATAHYRNNREFMNQAPRAARAQQAVGGSPDAPVIGAPIPFLNTDNPLRLVEAMSVAARDLAATTGATGAGPASPGATAETPAAPAAPGGGEHSGAAAPPSSGAAAPAAPAHARRGRPAHVVPHTQNIAELSIFTHGSHGAIELGSMGWANAGTVSAGLSAMLAPGVRINLYACSAASGDGSFAENLAENLARDQDNPHTADVFGHTTYGNTATLAAGRHFHADAGAGAEATSTTNWQLVFDQTFIAEQAAAISTALIAEHPEATPEHLVSVIRNDDCGPRWLSGALQRVQIEMRGRGEGTQQLPAAFVIGMDPDRARDAVREHWRLPEQGQTTVRTYLTRHAAGAGGHRGRR